MPANDTQAIYGHKSNPAVLFNLANSFIVKRIIIHNKVITTIPPNIDCSPKKTIDHRRFNDNCRA